MARLEISKKKLFLLFLIVSLVYIFRGINVNISNDSHSKIKDITLIYADKKIFLGDLKNHRELNSRIIKPSREANIHLKYRIEELGCFITNIDTYIENDYVGDSNIIFLENGNIAYFEKIYTSVISELLRPKGWGYKIINSKKILCKESTPSKI